MSILATSIALALMNAGCGGAADTTAAVTEAAVAGADATTLDLDETGKRRRESDPRRTSNSTTSTTATTIPTTTTSTTATTATTATSPTSPTSPTTGSESIQSSSTVITTPALVASNSNVTTTSNSVTTIGTPSQVTPGPIQGPLLTETNLTYLGGFRLPLASDQDLGSSHFGWGGAAITSYLDPTTGKLTLYMQGHPSKPGHISQIEVPEQFVVSENWSDLPTAKVIKKFQDVTNGLLSTLGDSSGSSVSLYGILPYNNKLILSASIFYTYVQNASHAITSLDFSSSGNTQGFYPFTSDTLAPSRALGGSMDYIPPAWRSALGGPAVTGQQSMPVISTNSAGPSLTVFDPNDVGLKNQIPGKTLLYYPVDAPLCGSAGCDNAANPIYNGISTIRGRAMVPNTRSILFVGSHSGGQYWYGDNPSPTGLYDSIRPSGRGPHATAYEYRIWAYDVNDLVAVKAGSKLPHEVRPYKIWQLPELTKLDPTAYITGVAFDPGSSMIFVTTAYGDKPRVEVYKIKLQ